MIFNLAAWARRCDARVLGSVAVGGALLFGGVVSLWGRQTRGLRKNAWGRKNQSLSIARGSCRSAQPQLCIHLIYLCRYRPWTIRAPACKPSHKVGSSDERFCAQRLCNLSSLAWINITRPERLRSSVKLHEIITLANYLEQCFALNTLSRI